MKKMKKTVLSMMALAFCAGTVLTSCEGNEVEPTDLTKGSGVDNPVFEATGIPSDDIADQTTPDVVRDLDDDDSNTPIPNPSTNLVVENGYVTLNIDMTGIKAKNNTWLVLAGTGTGSNQNVWVTVDGKAKGVDVYNTSEGQGSRKMLADVVFLVDDSGSMSEEADAIARDIISWSNTLANSGLDVRFGCVGYGDGSPAIDGAINVTTSEELSNFLNRSTGTYRTNGYAGDDADALRAAVSSYNHTGYNECGMAALRFANDQFKYRDGSNRVYINFTDEPNQPSNDPDYSVEKLKDANFWTAAHGTIHSVFSADTTFTVTPLYKERPWLMADYTGGTKIFTDRYFTNVTLDSLPVSGALQNSYKLRITNLDEFKDGKPHEVKIIVYADNGDIIAVKTIYVIFS